MRELERRRRRSSELSVAATEALGKAARALFSLLSLLSLPSPSVPGPPRAAARYMMSLGAREEPALALAKLVHENDFGLAYMALRATMVYPCTWTFSSCA